MREHLQNEIENLTHRIEQLAEEVERAVRLAVRAAENSERDLALQVIAYDDQIDAEEVRLEEECLKILALHQPVAGDLRYIVTFLKVNNELERIGDLGVNIAKRAITLSSLTEPDAIGERMDSGPQEQLARQMLKRSLDALITRNCGEAEAVIRLDDEMDELNAANVERAMQLARLHPERLEYYVNRMFISKHLERIGDCSTNICEDILYLEQGRICRHAR